MKDRLKDLRKELNLTQQEFADKLGIKRTTISNYEVGRNTPVDSVIALICDRFQVNKDWLLTGRGEMFVQAKHDEDLERLINSMLVEDNADLKRRLVAAILKLTPEQINRCANWIRDVFGVADPAAAAPDVTDTDVGNTTAADQTDTTAADRDSAGINVGSLAAEQESEDMTIDEKVASYRAELEAARKGADSASQMPTEREA